MIPTRNIDNRKVKIEGPVTFRVNCARYLASFLMDHCKRGYLK